MAAAASNRNRPDSHVWLPCAYRRVAITVSFVRHVIDIGWRSRNAGETLSLCWQEARCYQVLLGKAQKACLRPLPVLWVPGKALQALFLLVLRALALHRGHTVAVLWVDTCLSKRKNAN